MKFPLQNFDFLNLMNDFIKNEKIENHNIFYNFQTNAKN